ncbi:MAG: hypothetical protein NXI29_05495 [bacterium]|nr:hypothetical protein [bacterium]
MPNVSEVLSKPVNRLRSKVKRGAVGNVDREGGDNGAGLISDFSVITRGEALGHSMWCDAEFLQQVHDAINQAGEAGLKARFTHPGLSADGLGKFLGNIKNASMKGVQVIADLHFSKSAHKTPDGNLADYVMDFAEEDPDKFGSSIVFMQDFKAQELFRVEHKNEDSGEFESPDSDNKKNYEHCRLSKLYGADIVDDPAANPNGLFHRGQEIPQNAGALLDYALGIEGAEKPSEFSFGIDPDRLSAYLDRYLDNHGLKIVSKGEPEEMAKENENPSKPEPTAEELRSQIIAEYNANMNRYIQKFGAENGAKWLGEGKSYTEACELHIGELNKQLEAKDEDYAELQKKFDSIDLGEDDALESGEAKGGKPTGNKFDAFQALHKMK